MFFEFINILFNIFLIKPNKIFFSIVLFSLISSSIIKIPFKILDPNEKKDNEDIFDIYVKLISEIEIGNPLQKIETLFDLRISNFFISNYCYNCSDSYNYNKSSTFAKIKTLKTDKPPEGPNNPFYAYETFYFYDAITNQKIEFQNMLFYLPEKIPNKNSFTIGLRFYDKHDNAFQRPFIDQLKSRKIINKYCWTMVFYENNKYDGAFLFGDILDYYYTRIENYSSNRLVYTYTGGKKMDENSNGYYGLEWGITFNEIYYELPESGNEYINNKVNIYDFSSEFDFNINAIYGTYEYSRNIQRDYFNYYFLKNICQPNYLKGGFFKYISCFSGNFTQKDLEKFPSINFINKELRFSFSFNYKDLFYLTKDKKYYIFNIMMISIYNPDYFYEDNFYGYKWVLGLPFLKKYQFSFDSDNKLIYFYNKNEKFLDNIFPKNIEKENFDKNSDDIINENENNSDSPILNKQNKEEKNKKKEKKVLIEVNKIALFIILIIIFIVLFCFLILIIRKLLFKKGFIIIRAKKANELDENEYYDYSSKNINYNKKDDFKNKELEMQSKK